MIQIKHRSTGKVIKEVDATSLMNADLQGADLNFAKLQNANLLGANLRCADLTFAKLQNANLLGADLRGADLRYANLRYANLRGSDLRGADLLGADLQYANLRGSDLRDANLQNTNLRWVLGDGKRIKTIGDHYRIVIMQEYGVMAIGCEQHSIAKWMNFSDEKIDKMDTDALHWWKEEKPRIQQLIVG
jgi:uncharacterized protein YjbI with pentapeptide repeats